MSRPLADADVFRAIADPTRRRILEVLCEAEATSGEIVERLRRSPAGISQHLGVLRASGLVTQARRGTHRVYRCRKTHLRTVNAWLKRLGVA